MPVHLLDVILECLTSKKQLKASQQVSGKLEWNFNLFLHNAWTKCKQEKFLEKLKTSLAGSGSKNVYFERQRAISIANIAESTKKMSTSKNKEQFSLQILLNLVKHLLDFNSKL